MASQYQSSRPDESHLPPRQTPKSTDASEYLCGDCGAKTMIKMGELIRCRECGHRVMYKPRTHKNYTLDVANEDTLTLQVQFEAR